jgi:hypothetical protein
MFRYESDYTPPNADYTHDSEREHQLDTLATEVSNDLDLDEVAARTWARANLDDLLRYAAEWDADQARERATVEWWGSAFEEGNAE